MPLFATTQQGLLDYLIATFGASTKYIGLSSTLPTRTATNITEPSSGSYARMSTVAADWAAASGSVPSLVTNSVAKLGPVASGDWLSGVNLPYWVLYTALTAGTPLLWGDITVPRPFLTGDQPNFPIGSLAVKLGAPADTY